MACNCTLMNGGIPIPCGGNAGGIDKIYITDFCNVENGFVDSSPVGIIESITMAGSSVYYEFEFNQGTSTWGEVNPSDRATGIDVWNQTATLVLNKRQRSTREALALLIQKKLSVIVKDNNGFYWLLGKGRGVWASNTEYVAGTAVTDPNKYTITLIASESEQAYPVTMTAVEAVIA